MTDSSGIVINEAAAHFLGFTDPIGQKIYELDDVKTKKTRAFHVIGVIKDFNFNTLREVVTPLALFLDDQDEPMRSRALSLLLMLEMKAPQGAPTRCLTCLAARAPRVLLAAARAVVARLPEPPCPGADLRPVAGNS